METRIKSSLFAKRYILYLLVLFNTIACNQNSSTNTETDSQQIANDSHSNHVQHITDSITHEDLIKEKIFLDFWYNMPKGKYELILKKEINGGKILFNKDTSAIKNGFIFPADLLINNEVQRREFIFEPIFENDSLRKIILRSPSSKLHEILSDNRGVEMGRPQYIANELGKKEFKAMLIEKYGKPEVIRSSVEEKIAGADCELIRSIFRSTNKVIIWEEVYWETTFIDNSKSPVVFSKGETYLKDFTVTYTSTYQHNLEQEQGKLRGKLKEEKRLQKINSTKNNI